MDAAALQSILAQSNRLMNEGKAAAARDLLTPVMDQFPQSPQLAYTLGTVLYSLGQIQDAMHRFEKAVNLKPDHAPYCNALGACLNSLGAPEMAIEMYKRALQLDPAGWDTYYNLGNALGKLGHTDEAIASYQNALRISPTNISIHGNLANALRAARRFDEAIAYLQTALVIDPNSSLIHVNLGNIYLDIKYNKTGLYHLFRAHDLNPNENHVESNIALGLMADHHIDDAIAYLDGLIAATPDDDRLIMIRAHAKLHQGRYADGWRDYENRIYAKDKVQRHEPGQLWDGSSYPGKRLVIIAEQGLGDALWIARYLPRVKALGGELIMECAPEIMPMIAAMGAVDRFVERREDTVLPDADYFLYQCSLPALFSPDVASIPGEPYFKPDPAQAAKFLPALAKGEGKLKVGIIWSGNTKFPGNYDRAAPLSLFMQSLAMPGVQLYSLQKGEPAKDLQGNVSSAPIIDMDPLIHNFLDTATLASMLDLVIMTDTSTAHLVGALGKPIWLLLNYLPNWLWRTTGSTSPWYPSMRIFRPAAWNDWRGIFDEASTELRKLASPQRP